MGIKWHLNILYLPQSKLEQNEPKITIVGNLQLPHLSIGFIFCWVLFGIYKFSSAWILIFDTYCIYMYVYLCLICDSKGRYTLLYFIAILFYN
jgi:hypothetical protein